MFSKETGITRLPCFILLIIASLFGYALKVYTPLDEFVCNIINYLLFSIILYFRAQNIGWNKWWALIGLVPFINIFILLPAVAFPQNYANTKKLDKRGQFIIFGFIAIYIIPFIVVSTMLTVNKSVHNSLDKVSSKITASQPSKAPAAE